MKSKHGTARNVDEFIKYLIDDLRDDGAFTGSHSDDAKIEIIFGRIRDFISNKMCADPRLSAETNDTLIARYKKMMGENHES